MRVDLSVPPERHEAVLKLASDVNKVLEGHDGKEGFLALLYNMFTTLRDGPNKRAQFLDACAQGFDAMVQADEIIAKVKEEHPMVAAKPGIN